MWGKLKFGNSVDIYLIPYSLLCYAPKDLYIVIADKEKGHVFSLYNRLAGNYTCEF